MISFPFVLFISFTLAVIIHFHYGWHHGKFSAKIVPKGVEPSFSDRKSDVLPLRQGTIKVGVPDSNW